ncbi:MAG: SDR family oxidoreductase [Symploca sp. SIO2G7]|nr:SDR family oxidoreductase [Symploca sp. SIO2G7]
MTSRNKPLQGKTAIITGSGQNIGREIALLFAATGANVVINGHRNQDAIEKVAQEAQDLGSKAIAVLADISDPNAIQAMVDQAIAEFGGVDIAVSNVSLRIRQGILDISNEDWRRVIDTNLSSAFYLARATLPGMKAREWGRIIHISGEDGFTGAAYRAHNVASKAGLHALSKAIAIEFGPYGVTANTVSPGTIDTLRIPENYPNWGSRYAEATKAIPSRRIGSCQDIAEACLYLASDAAGFVNSQVIHVNGGAFIPWGIVEQKD